MTNAIVYCVLVASILALTFAFIFYKQMMKEDEGTDIIGDGSCHLTIKTDIGNITVEEK